MKNQKLLKKIPIIVATLLSLAFLQGCALDGLFNYMGFGGGTASPDTPESLAMKAIDKFNHGKYEDALEIFDDIKEQFPFSQHSLLAELKSADCNFYMNNFAEAIVLYDDFALSHPTNEALPYVLFQSAMAYYKQIDTIDRDPGAALDAIAGFAKLLKSYPNSPFTEEALARTLAARSFLANHEFYVATFYIRSGSIPQAESRLEYLLMSYPDTEAAQEAEGILAAIKAGNPPKRSWKDWIPDIALPDWTTFRAMTPGGVSGGAPGE